MSFYHLYLASEYQHNGFKFGKLDPVTFAERMGYHYDNLMRHLPEDKIYQLELDRASEKSGRQHWSRDDYEKNDHYVWDSVLENALYKMSHIRFELLLKEETADREVRGKEQFSILRGIYMEKDKSRKKDRYEFKTYQYRVDEFFIRNLTMFFFNLDNVVFPKLRTDGLQSLYLYVSNLWDDLKLINSGKSPDKFKHGTPHFNYLSQICQVDHYSQQFKKKQKISDMFDTLNKYVKQKITLEWHTNGGRYAYKPIIRFPHYNTYSDDQLFTIQGRSFDDYFLQKLREVYQNEYVSRLQGPNRLGFGEWCKLDHQNWKAKQNAYVAAIRELYNRTIGPNDQEVFNYFNHKPHFIDRTQQHSQQAQLQLKLFADGLPQPVALPPASEMGL